MPTDLLFGSSNLMEIIALFTDTTKYPPSSPEIMQPLQENHMAYGTAPYRLLVPICMGDVSHFFAVDIKFDINSDEVFRDVTVYDSLLPPAASRNATSNDDSSRRTTRASATAEAHLRKVLKSSPAARFLRSLQTFLLRYCFVHKQGSTPYNVLESNPDYIIERATYENCPQQNNTWDCGLYSLALVLHLAHNIPITPDVFVQDHISNFRSALHKEFSTFLATRSGTRSIPFLTPSFIYSFFPNLRSLQTLSGHHEPPPPARKAVNNKAAPRPESATTQNMKDHRGNDVLVVVDVDGSTTSTTEGLVQEVLVDDDNNVLVDDDATSTGTTTTNNEEQDANTITTNSIDGNDNKDTNTMETQQKDKYFLQRFIPSIGEEGPPFYPDYEDIFRLIDEYESVSGVRLIIRRSKNDGRLYCCGSHENCGFKAQFGRVRGSPQFISLKPENSWFIHNGPPLPEFARDGRTKKRRLARRVNRAIDKVSEVKAMPAIPWDVVKSSVNTEEFDITYKQGHSVLSRHRESSQAKAKASYQKLVPYLKEFGRLNPGSLSFSELDDQKHLSRVFVCPGIMLGSLMHVRPVMSLDAAHLKTTGGGGILYMASVKSASNDLYPVAVAITVDNENKDGWIWFLESLQASLPILEQPHPKEGVAYNRFTFMSDRQKGLLEALKVVFPNNHSCYCAVHIARNVEAKFGGPQQAKYVIPLSKTFSMTEAEQLLQAMSRRVREYVAEIEEPQWRSTAWLVDEALPPRYGIVTSNMSESLNSMFERARDVHWKHTIQIILSKMVERIAELSQKYEEKAGVIDEVVCRLQYYWQHCAGLVVVPMKDSAQTLFTVFTHSGGVVDENVAGYNMNVATRSCDCGLWQEHEYPCIHAVAYYKKHLQFNFDQLLNEVDRKYTYESEKLLFSKNFLSVCDDRIVGDKSILPPCFKQKKAGRTKKKRHRQRSLHGASSSCKKKCGRCGQPGHNARTCGRVRAKIPSAPEQKEEHDDERKEGKNGPGAVRDKFEHLPELDLL